MAAAKLSGIYEIVNSINGKRYVGSAVNTRQRWNQHRHHLRRGDHPNRHLQSSFAKHGEAAFSFRVLEECSPDLLIEREQAAIDLFKPEFNICPFAGSTAGRRHSEETRRKIGDKKIGMKMPPRSAEHCKALSAFQLGKAKAAEHNAALQEGRRNRVIGVEENAKRSNSLKKAYAEGNHRVDRPAEYREKIANTLREQSKSSDVRRRLSSQAASAWASRSEEERHDHMEKMRAARKPVTEEQRRAISERQRGRPIHENAATAMREANLGRPLTEEHRAKISASNLKSWTPERKAKQAAAMRDFHASRRAPKAPQ